MWTLVNLSIGFATFMIFFHRHEKYDKGDKTPYRTVKSDEWNATGNAGFYFFRKNFNQNKFAGLIDEIAPDAYTNSAFATPVVKFSGAAQMFADAPVISRRGEFSEDALRFGQAAA